MSWELEICASLLILLLTLLLLFRRRIRLKYYDYQQNSLKQKVLFGKDDFEKCKLIGGIDISFIKNDDVNACISLVVIDLETLEQVHAHTAMIKMTCPYIPGYLAFRETPHIRTILQHTLSATPQFYPDVLVVDGNGRLHNKQFGLACHTGVLCDVPCIGVAKNLFQMAGCLRDDDHKDAIKSLESPGDFFDIHNVEDVVIGCAMRTTKASTKPVYVSEGHRISLESARSIVVRCSKYRVPEPVRLADLGSREVLREMEG